MIQFSLQPIHLLSLLLGRPLYFLELTQLCLNLLSGLLILSKLLIFMRQPSWAKCLLFVAAVGGGFFVPFTHGLIFQWGLIDRIWIVFFVDGFILSGSGVVVRLNSHTLLCPWKLSLSFFMIALTDLLFLAECQLLSEFADFCILFLSYPAPFLFQSGYFS